MKTKSEYAQELLRKEERVCAWEDHGVLDADFCETPRIEYWYVED